MIISAFIFPAYEILHVVCVCVYIRCPPELGLSKNSPVKVQVVEEGSEPADFWTALGQMDRKAYDSMLQGTRQHTLSALSTQDHFLKPVNFQFIVKSYTSVLCQIQENITSHLVSSI